MAWCEANQVEYVFGLARNARLEARLANALNEAQRLSEANAGQPARAFRDFDWSTKESWSRRRRVIGKAEWTHGEANPRFLVTSLKADAWRAKPLYEELYCARGEMYPFGVGRLVGCAPTEESAQLSSPYEHS